jgi:hypothetical protein
MRYLDSLKFSLYVIFHPFKGFWDLKHEKRGSMAAAMTFIVLLIVTYILRRQYTGFIFNQNDPKELNVFVEIISVLLPFFLWATANWCITTLMEGEGSYRDIVIATAYALVPLILINLPLIPLSRIINIEEGAFYYFFGSVSVLWTGILILAGASVTHQYTMTKTVFTSILSVVGMGLMIFIGLLVFSLLQQMISFVYTIYREIAFRL